VAVLLLQSMRLGVTISWDKVLAVVLR